MPNLSLGSLFSTSEGWALVATFAGMLFQDELIPIPEIVQADAGLMAWIIIAKIIVIGFAACIYINARGRVKEANGK